MDANSKYTPDYAYPNDLLEQDRFDFQHDVFKVLLQGRLHISPFTAENPPREVLDVGTGTGRWAVEMGDLYPTARIRGFDLSPIQPVDVPQNVHFYVDDA
jgi:metalloendopeptidase OMA1, mitochondrial